MRSSSGPCNDMRAKTPLTLLILFPLLLACGNVDSLESGSSASGCGQNGCFSSDAAIDSGASDVSTDIGNDAEGDSGSHVNPLCGSILICVPDDVQASQCNTSVADSGPNIDASEDADIEADIDADVDADLDAGIREIDGDEAGETGMMGGSMGGSQTPYDDPDDEIPPPSDPWDDDEAPPARACQVTTDLNNERIAECVPGGLGFDSDPCVTSADCSAGYACVGEKAGVCRSYCCLDTEACPKQSYCGVRPSRDMMSDDSGERFMLPVCIPAEACELLPGLGGNRCSEGLMCAIVRADGTTACVQPGTAEEGEPCQLAAPDQSPCAEGFVCSKATNTCLALCSVNALDACGGGVCQGGTNGIPGDYGVCVGPRD